MKLIWSFYSVKEDINHRISSSYLIDTDMDVYCYEKWRLKTNMAPGYICNTVSLFNAIFHHEALIYKISEYICNTYLLFSVLYLFFAPFSSLFPPENHPRVFWRQNSRRRRQNWADDIFRWCYRRTQACKRSPGIYYIYSQSTGSFLD